MGALKVFPLPSVVLFPHLATPLHIFEPRYRELVRDSLAGESVFALAQLKPGWEVHYADRPPLEPICCAGVISWHEQLADGRYNLVLQGLTRVRVLEELPPRHGYREVRAELLEDPAYDGPENAQLREAVFELSGRLPDEVANPFLELATRASGGQLADVVAATVVSDVERRQELLCELNPRKRLQEALSEVAGLLVRLAPSRPRGPMN